MNTVILANVQDILKIIVEKIPRQKHFKNTLIQIVKTIFEKIQKLKKK